MIDLDRGSLGILKGAYKTIVCYKIFGEEILASQSFDARDG